MDFTNCTLQQLVKSFQKVEEGTKCLKHQIIEKYDEECCDVYSTSKSPYPFSPRDFVSFKMTHIEEDYALISSLPTERKDYPAKKGIVRGTVGDLFISRSSSPKNHKMEWYFFLDRR